MARQYFEDESIKDACPPLRALLAIMAEGSFEGKDVHHPEIRRLFTLDYLLGSDWYRERLAAKQRSDIALWQRHLRYVDASLANRVHLWAENPSELLRRRETAAVELERASSVTYLEVLNGTLGLDPSLLAFSVRNST